jgi:beta-glucosidase
VLSQVLAGDVSPSGRLTHTWVRSVGYVGTNSQPYYQFPALTTHDWMDGEASALWEYGYGLSYSTFSFSSLVVSALPPADAAKGHNVEASVTVANTGRVASSVTAQAYCSYLDSPRLRVVRWASMLCGFTKVFLRPGQATTAHVNITLSTLARWDPRALSTDLLGHAVAGAYVVDAGRWRVAVGDCSGAAVAAGYAAPHPCPQQRGTFEVARTLTFAGK